MVAQVNTARVSAASLLDELGITPIINAGGSNTRHSGTRPRPETMEAMLAMSQVFVQMDEYLLAVGAAIAAEIGVEAATVTSGASGGLVLQAAAALTRDDPQRIARLPDTDGCPNELIIQRAQRFTYDRLYRVPGAKLVEVGTPAGCSPEELEAAIGPQTAGIIDVQSSFKRGGAVPLPKLAEIAHRHGLPVLCDAASLLPPRANLRKFYDEGADLVVFSGGKGIRGPQSTGIVLGRREWVRYAHLNNAPSPTIARAQKVSREEAAGLLAAVRAFLAEDEAAETERYRTAMQQVVDALAGIPGVEAKVCHDYDHHYPQAVVTLTAEWRGPDRNALHAELMAGRPRVYLSPLDPGNRLTVDPLNLQPGELEIVIERLGETLRGHA